MTKNNSIPAIALGAVCAISLFVSPARAQISVYISAPNASNSGFSNTDVETFLTAGPVGIKTTPFLSPNYGVNVAGVTGTYTGSGSNPYFIGPGSDPWSFGDEYIAVGAQSGSAAPVSLQLTNKVHYFGFAWGAGDDNNRVSFYNGASLLGTFSSLDIQSLLANPTVTAVNGSIYNSPDYRGQPGSGHTINNSENYAFVHFLISAGTDRIDFFNTNTGTGFESDNHTIRTTAPDVTGSSLVFVTNLNATAPEPGTLALLLLGAAGGLVLKRRR